MVTDGPAGAYASDGSDPLRIPAYPDPGVPVERTGAGDAFASALVAGLVKGLPLAEALAWGPVNAMHVVQEVGSQAGLVSDRDLLGPEGRPHRLHHHDVVNVPRLATVGEETGEPPGSRRTPSWPQTSVARRCVRSWAPTGRSSNGRPQPHQVMPTCPRR